MADPLVSVIIPTYNSARYLPATLESVLAQAYRPLEIVVVDDGSTDDTVAAIAPYRTRLEYVRQENSGGPARPRNVGLARARGELVAIFDSDDVMLPGKLAAEVAVLAAAPEIDLVFTNFRVIDAEGRVTVSDFLADYRQFRAALRPAAHAGCAVLSGDVLYGELLRANFVGTSSVLARRRTLLDVGGFDETLRNSDDRDLWFRLALAERTFAFLDEVLHAYRQRPGSVTTRHTQRMPSVITVLKKQRRHVRSARERRLLEQRIRRLEVGLAWGLRQEGRWDEAEAAYRRLLQKRWSWAAWRGLWLTHLRRRRAR